MSDLKQVLVPDIGGDEVEVTEILVAVGDTIEQEQSLISVEGDKAAMEVPSEVSGVVKEIKLSVGDKVSEGSLILMIEAAGDATSSPAEAPTPAAAPAQAAPVAPVAAGNSEVIEIKVPDIGGDEVEVTEVLVNVGDEIELEQSIISVEGDKAAMEVPSSSAGIIKEIKIAVGDKVSEGTLILLIESATNSAAAAAPKAQAAQAPASTPSATTSSEIIEIAVPDIGGDEVEVTELLVSIGDEVEIEQSLISVEGDKAAMEVPSSAAGTVKEIKVAVGDKVSEGSLIIVLQGAAVSAPAATPSEPAINLAPPAPKSIPESKPPVPFHPSVGTPANSGKVHATPSVRRLAREFGVDLSQIKGTGRKNRILKEDVQAYVKYELSRPKASAATTTGSGNGLQVIAQPKVDFAKFGEIEEVPLSRIQKISGPSLHRNWVTIPHVTQFDEADTTDLEEFRKDQNAVAAKRDLGYKLSPLVFMLKAAARALELHPTFNSSLSADGESLILKKYINIGIAVDTPNGLVVPVIKDVNKKGIIELTKEMGVISKKARDGKLTGKDMQGSTFTISSLGGIGGTQFTPIVNAPDVAILGVSRAEMKPKWNGKDFEPRLMVPLALSYDHRVIDGANGARFITTLSGILGDLRQLIM